MYPEDVMADILIVEDNKELAVLLADFLCAAGYSVCTAATGNEALELYKEKGAKLVLLDIMLPGTDGFAVCRKIREEDNVPEENGSFPPLLLPFLRHFFSLQMPSGFPL